MRDSFLLGFTRLPVYTGRLSRAFSFHIFILSEAKDLLS